MSRNRVDFHSFRIGRYLWLGLFLVSVLLGLVWGAYFDVGVYTTYRFAQNLAAGRGLAHDAGIAPLVAPRAPLTIGILALLSPIMTQAGLLLSMLGWAATAVTLYAVSRAVERPFTAIIVPILILFNPLLPATLGSTTSWIIALSWLAIGLFTRPLAASGKRAWLKQTIILLLLLGTHFDASTVGLVILLLGRQWRRSKQAPWLPMLILLTVIAGWIGFVASRWDVWGMIRPFSGDNPLIQLLDSSELYWVFLPFLLLGIWGTKDWYSKTRMLPGVVFLWTALTWLAGSQMMGGVTAVTALFLVGLGIERLINWASEKQIVGISPAWLALAFTLPLLFVQLLSFWQQYSTRLVAQVALETELADWLQAHSELDATLYAAPRIGYLADRATLPAELDQRTVSDRLATLIEVEPNFIISAKHIAWNDITRNGWFQDRYASIQQFSSSYVASAPLTVWEHTQTPFDTGEIQPISAVIPGKIEMVGYKYEPAEIEPGDNVYLTIYLQATQPISVGFQTQANLSYVLDGWIWTWKRKLTPHSIPGHLWQPGQIIPERFVLETGETTPYGAYKLQVWWSWADDESLWPIYRDNDDNVLDRVMLGYVAIPPPVDDGDALPAKARFDDQIMLSGYEIGGDPTPGGTVEITLYWQTLQPPDDNYFVFVHLLDRSGQAAANHDGQPMDGRFVTRSWQSGMMVADIHPLALPPDLSPGEYQVMVGLYQRETGARLPVWDVDGVEQANGSWLLTQLTISNGQ